MMAISDRSTTAKIVHLSMTIESDYKHQVYTRKVLQDLVSAIDKTLH